jgi:hypothetical protein
MPLVPNFSASQTIGLPSVVTLTDTSTGSDGTITARRVYLQKYDDTNLVPSGNTTGYVEWDFADSSINIDALDKDYALNIKVEWLNASNVIVYSKVLLFQFSLYNEQFYYDLTRIQTSNPNIIYNTQYYENKMALRVELDSAANSVSLGGNISNAQYSLDRATYYRINQAKLF